MCVRAGFYRGTSAPDPGALEALALVLGVRGTPWRILVLCARAFSGWAHESPRDVCVVLAHACLACALQVCTPSNRAALARDVLAARVLHAAHLPECSAAPAAEQSTDAAHDAALLHELSTHALSAEAAVAILHGALRKRGGASVLARRLPSYLFSAREMLAGRDTQWLADDDDAPAAEAPRSVKTL